MTRDEVDAFFAAKNKTLPAAPEWRQRTARVAERRAYLPIAVGGVITSAQLALIVFVNDPGYLTVNVLAPTCVARLCLSGSHWDRLSGEWLTKPHWHSWTLNRPSHHGLPKELLRAQEVAEDLTSRDVAFAWLLKEIEIESPPWPLVWPDTGTLI